MARPRISIVAVGDMQLGDSAICVGFGFRSRHRGSDDFIRGFEGVRPVLAGGDIVFGNLETVLSDVGCRADDWRSVQMRGRPAFGEALARVGFTVVNVANNHAAQHGRDAFRDSLALLERAGIACCGVRGDAPWASRPVRVTTPDGARVGIVGYCRRPRQYGSETPPYAEGSDTEILGDIARLKADVDYVVVSLHWGEEFVTQPSAVEQAFGHALVDAGAALILGHHPHVARPVESYRQGVIAYSLGNFVADMIWQPVLRRGLVLRCSVGEEGASVDQLATTYIEVDFHPTVAGMRSGIESAADSGLDPVSYDRAIKTTVRSQRRASYWYALRNIYRYPPQVLVRLIGTTLRNKLVGVFG